MWLGQLSTQPGTCAAMEWRGFGTAPWQGDSNPSDHSEMPHPPSALPASCMSSFLRLPGKPWGTPGWEAHSAFSGTICSKGQGSCAGGDQRGLVCPGAHTPAPRHLGWTQVSSMQHLSWVCTASGFCCLGTRQGNARNGWERELTPGFHTA